MDEVWEEYCEYGFLDALAAAEDEIRLCQDYGHRFIQIETGGDS